MTQRSSAWASVASDAASPSARALAMRAVRSVRRRLLEAVDDARIVGPEVVQRDDLEDEQVRLRRLGWEPAQDEVCGGGLAGEGHHDLLLQVRRGEGGQRLHLLGVSVQPLAGRIANLGRQLCRDRFDGSLIRARLGRIVRPDYGCQQESGGYQGNEGSFVAHRVMIPRGRT